MHMLGRYDPGVDGKGMGPFHAPDESPLHIDMLHQEIVAVALQQIRCEKPACPWSGARDDSQASLLRDL